MQQQEAADSKELYLEITQLGVFKPRIPEQSLVEKVREINVVKPVQN